MITSEQREAILAAIDLAALVEEYGVSLRRVGNHHIGLCPFHDEKTPSFTVYEEHFHCFGCQEHGTAIDLVMQQRCCGFREAVVWLAERVGMSFEPSDLRTRPREPQVSTPRQRAVRTREDTFNRLRALWAQRRALSDAGAATPAIRDALLDDLADLADEEAQLVIAFSDSTKIANSHARA